MSCEMHICENCTCHRQASFVHANSNVQQATDRPENLRRMKFIDAVKKAEHDFKGSMKILS